MLQVTSNALRQQVMNNEGRYCVVKLKFVSDNHIFCIQNPHYGMRFTNY